MPSIDKRQRAIDVPAAAVGGGGGIISNSGGTGAGAGVPAPLAPTGLRLGTPFLIFSAVSPLAGLNAAWQAPPGGQVDGYLIQWSLDSLFSAPTSRAVAAGQTSATLDGMPVNVTVWVRVAALVRGVQGAWSAAISALTPDDTIPPDPPTGLGYTWRGDTGNLYLSCTPPTNANYRDVRFRIYSADGGTLLHTYYSASGQATWTLAEHAVDTSGVYDAAVYVLADARNWSNAYSSTVSTSPSLAAPAAPSGLASTWASDSGTAGPDLTLLWTLDATVARYRLTLDGVARDVGQASRYTYSLATNAAEHSGTPDPVISVSLVAINALGQVSTAATLTATNAAPPATSISASGSFSAFTLTITASTAADLLDYRVRAYLNGSGTPAATFYVRDLLSIYEPTSSGSWRFDVSARDVFGQHGTASSLTTAASSISMAAFVADLRAGLLYSDSEGRAAESLKAALANDDLTNAFLYASGSAWKWIQADWQEEIRHRTTTVAGSPVALFLATSLDGSTWTYHYGGSISGGAWTPSNTTSTQATAEAGSITIGDSIAGSTPLRVQLSATVRCRYIRLYHRNPSAAYDVREFYPRRLIQADDIQSEAITARLIAAGTITGDRIAAGTITASLISVSSLSAISANLGTITAGVIGAVTINGATINGGSVTAGAGAVVLDSAGITIDDATLSGATKIDFQSGAYMGRIPGTSPATRTAIVDSAGAELATTSGDLNFDAVKGRTAYSGAGVLVSGGVYVGGVLYPEDGIAVESWKNATLVNSWVNFGGSNPTPGYCRDAFGFVHLRGLIKDGAIGTVAFTLPTGYRPPASWYFATVSNNAFGYGYIGADGSVNISGGSNTWFALNIPPFRTS